MKLIVTARILALALGLSVSVPARAQESLVFDSNILFDNNAGSYGTESGGPACPGGMFTTTQLATVKFTRNQSVNPLLNSQVYNLGNPRWDPQLGSPALTAWGAAPLRASAIHPWFQDVCYIGALNYTARVDANDWTTGWTYYNQNGGADRTDINLALPAINVLSDITAHRTFSPDTLYYLVGRVAVQPPATLTVLPGTVVLGSGVGSYLVIERGAKINANGTRTQPIIFTSGSNLGSQTPGDWGGVVLHGRAQANCAAVMSCALTSATASCISEGNAGMFGGTDDTDDKGVIRYARVEYSGLVIATDNELNCWTMNAVGSQTVMEYMQACFGTDDGFEWFGGDTRNRYLVANANQDDNLDWQMGARGLVQFAVVSQTALTGTDKAVEADNNEFNFNCTLRSNMKMSNLTLVGPGPASDVIGGPGINLRRGTAGTIVNSIIQGFTGAGLRIQNAETFAVCAGTAPAAQTCTSDAGPEVRNGFTVAASRSPTFDRTSIQFNLPEARHVRVNVFDAAGRLVETLADAEFEAGAHSLPWNAAKQASGAYFFRVTAGTETETRRVVVLR